MSCLCPHRNIQSKDSNSGNAEDTVFPHAKFIVNCLSFQFSQESIEDWSYICDGKEA